MRERWVKRGVKIAMLAPLAFVVVGFLIMLLWNWLATAIFRLPPINFWQAWGIFLLSKLLFGGFHGGPNRGGNWKHRMRAHWQRMTPEEREQFLRGMDGPAPHAA